jgi:cobalt-zinc-cadmium efflux system protein
VAIVLTVLFVMGEAAAGLYANSLALLSDAAHNFTDVLALGLSLYALYLSARPSNATKTFGYHRAGILAALVNATTLIGIALLIFYEAYERLVAPPPIQEQIMMIVAGVGFVINTSIAFFLRHFAQDLNVRSAFIHMVGDALSTLGVVIAGFAIHLTGWEILDPLASVLIGVLIAVSSWGILREGINVLLEGTPTGIDMEAMVRDLMGIDGVQGVHDLHAWSISSSMHALSAHVLTDDVSLSRGADIQREINQVLIERYHIGHTALQLECEGCSPDTLYCELGANRTRPAIPRWPSE